MTDFSCAQCRERLPLYVAGQLAASEHEQVERHLATCRGCRAVLRQWMVIEQALRLDDAHTPPDTTSERVWEAIWRELPNVSRQTTFGRNIRIPQLKTIEREDDEMQPDEEYRYNGQASATTLPERRPERGMGQPAPKRTRRRTLLLTLTSVTAAVAVVVALLGVFAVLSRGRTAQQVSCAPSQYRANLPVDSDIHAVSMVSPEEGWAVGQVWQYPKEPTTLIAHLSHCQWQFVAPPAPHTYMLALAMTSPTDGWAFGAQITSYTKLKNVPIEAYQTTYADSLSAFHYHNGAWRQVTFTDPTITPSRGDSIHVVDFRMQSADEGWLMLVVTRYHAEKNQPYRSDYVLMRYDGVSWSEVALPVEDTQAYTFLGFAAPAPDTYWIVGTRFGSEKAYNPIPLVFHYVAGGWRTQIGGLPNVDEVESLSFDSPTTGYALVTVGAGMKATLYKITNNTWTPSASPALPDASTPRGVLPIYYNLVVKNGVIWLEEDTANNKGLAVTIIWRWQNGHWLQAVRVIGEYGAPPESVFVPVSSDRAWTLAAGYSQHRFTGNGYNQLTLVDHSTVHVIPGQRFA